MPGSCPEGGGPAGRDPGRVFDAAAATTFSGAAAGHAVAGRACSASAGPRSTGRPATGSGCSTRCSGGGAAALACRCDRDGPPAWGAADGRADRGDPARSVDADPALRTFLESDAGGRAADADRLPQHRPAGHVRRAGDGWSTWRRSAGTSTPSWTPRRWPTRSCGSARVSLLRRDRRPDAGHPARRRCPRGPAPRAGQECPARVSGP